MKKILFAITPIPCIKYGLLALVTLLSVTSLASSNVNATSKQPNIIWLVLEDITSIDLGIYGNKQVKTPNLDRIAKQGSYYTNAYATSPVCSPARSAFFTGMHQTSIGAHQHRSHLHDGFQLPSHVKMLSHYLRQAGYFNLLMGPKQKTDFNFSHNVPAFDGQDGEIKHAAGVYTHAPLDMKILDKPAWSQFIKQQNKHQNKHKTSKNLPFFAQINYSETHRTFIADPKNPINPDTLKLPSYYPDHDIARRDWALYLETIQHVDQKVGALFEELEQAGVLDNTIIFIFGDHGRAMLRDKQWLYDSGIRVPFIVWGKGIEKGKVNKELVSLIDLAPTTLDLIGADVPKHMEGHVFLGNNKQPRSYVYAQRDRCDETDDRIRAVKDKRFKYIKNFFPHQPYTQFNQYKKLQYPVLTLMEKLHQAGKLTPQQALFFASSRPPEELYDTIDDPEELNNLANTPAYQQDLLRLRNELVRWQVETGDINMQPESQAVMSYWDDFFVKNYAKVMKSRGLSTDISHDEYLAWWDSFLTKLGK